MTVDHRQNHLESLRSALSVVLYPLMLVVDLPRDAGDWLRESVASRRALEEENARLRTEHLILKAQLQKLEALEAENLRLRQLLDSSFKIGERVLIAEILAVDLDPYRHQIVINKGGHDGIFVGQPLVDANGVMGQVVHVTPFSATAMLITDPAHAIPVQINRNGLRTVALGIGSLHRLSLPHIPNNADVRVGDLLVSSGLGGRFPPGYPVARVKEVIVDSGQSFARVFAEPLAALDRAREVLLVWNARTTGAEEGKAAAAEGEKAP